MASFHIQLAATLALPLTLCLLSAQAKAQTSASAPDVQQVLSSRSFSCGVVPAPILIQCRPLPSNLKPLFVVNGQIIDEDATNSLESINPSDIEKMQVMRGAEAAVKFGSRAINGVILITTKKPVATKNKYSHSEQIKKAGLE